ncbi:MAG: D-glycero-beta-D-manno-heptose 1-phosphate adenylyltransferase [Selenomonadaceae bacterium]|nr:D-glycero-beta-D-manno-heptose 1-phosphate adenylyltransferase [Selenomonadaceae bacterium]MBP3722646.1 D-glycero-beta-D-manno-heptose 1-phosphate adenylyltransferase [Selenomonadaceae bacterium]
MILKKSDAKAYVDIQKRSGKKTVFTNGCFDILHRGHIEYLTAAKSLGDVLVVGLNSDSSVKKLKGETRPLNTESDRAYVLDALKAVDVVVIFEEDTAEKIIDFIKPDVYAKGGDYTLETLPEAKVVASYGGKTELLNFVEGYSTTGIIEKMTL